MALITIPKNLLVARSDTPLVTEEIERAQLIIHQAFQRFTENQDLSSFPTALKAMQDLEKIQTRVQALEGFPEFQRIFKTCRAQIQQMNFVSPLVTLLDVRNMMTFVTPPPKTESIYVAEDGKKYHNPDHSHLLQMASRYFIDGHYQGFGLQRHKMWVYPRTGKKTPCDILTLSKQRRQISCEMNDNNPLTFNPLSWIEAAANKCMSSIVNDWIQEQNKAYLHVSAYLSINFKEWKYESFYIAGTKDLTETFGIPLDLAVEANAVILFYQEVI